MGNTPFKMKGWSPLKQDINDSDVPKKKLVAPFEGAPNTYVKPIEEKVYSTETGPNPDPNVKKVGPRIENVPTQTIETEGGVKPPTMDPTKTELVLSDYEKNVILDGREKIKNRDKVVNTVKKGISWGAKNTPIIGGLSYDMIKNIYSSFKR
tara:strand:+ start:52 stop:507 length:456 start_codon:yes stop_codon:yes gene_type:complete